MSLKNPIFIVGTGRCGSTLFHDVLTEHPSMGWLSSALERAPSKPWKNRVVNEAASAPLIGSYIRRAFRPAEPYRFWEKHCHGFATPYRNLVAEDVLPPVMIKVREGLGQAIPNDRRLLAKITGWPRIGYLKEIFPDAKFINIVRDGRAVVNSVLQAPYFDGWSGPLNWTRGDMDESQRSVWKESGESYVVLAAIGYENRMRAFSAAKQKMSAENYLEIKYESICDDPVEAYKRTLQFIGEDVSESDVFLSKVQSTRISSKNNKWKTDLTEAQQYFLEKSLCKVLSEYDYL